MRPNWLTYGLDIAETVAARSEDPYVKIGAVVMRDDHSIAGVGYNGPPPGVNIDWDDRDRRRDFIVHAEVNAFRDCLRRDVAGGMVLVTGVSCIPCLAVVASMGIKHVCFRHELENYPSQRSIETARALGIFLWQEKQYV